MSPKDATHDFYAIYLKISVSTARRLGKEKCFELYREKQVLEEELRKKKELKKQEKEQNISLKESFNEKNTNFSTKNIESITLKKEITKAEIKFKNSKNEVSSWPYTQKAYEELKESLKNIEDKKEVEKVLIEMELDIKIRAVSYLDSYMSGKLPPNEQKQRHLISCLKVVKGLKESVKKTTKENPKLIEIHS